MFKFFKKLIVGFIKLLKSIPIDHSKKYRHDNHCISNAPGPGNYYGAVDRPGY